MRILPYLSFDGSAREAMEHYRDALGGELDILTFEQGAGVDASTPFAQQVMHAALVAGTARIYASDWVPDFCGGEPYRPGSDVAITLEAAGPEDAEALRAAYRKLAEGGEVFMELGEADWGGEFGSLKDRFGKGWNISIPPAEQGAIA